MKKCVLFMFGLLFFLQAPCIAGEGVQLDDSEFQVRYKTLAASLYLPDIVYQMPIKREGDSISYAFITNEGAAISIKKDSRTNKIKYITLIAYTSEFNKLYTSTITCLMAAIGISPDDYIPHVRRLSGSSKGVEHIAQTNGEYHRICAGTVPIGGKQQGAILTSSVKAANLDEINEMDFLILFEWPDSMEFTSFFKPWQKAE